jgi:hypothetical protein
MDHNSDLVAKNIKPCSKVQIIRLFRGYGQRAAAANQFLCTYYSRSWRDQLFEPGKYNIVRRRQFPGQIYL